MYAEEFRYSTLVWKVLKTGAAALLIVVIAIQSVPVPETVNEWSDWKPWAVAVGIAILRGLANTWKTRELAGNPIGKIIPLLLVFGLAGSFAGCAMLPDGSIVPHLPTIRVLAEHATEVLARRAETEEERDRIREEHSEAQNAALLRLASGIRHAADLITRPGSDLTAEQAVLATMGWYEGMYVTTVEADVLLVLSKPELPEHESIEDIFLEMVVDWLNEPIG